MFKATGVREFIRKDVSDGKSWEELIARAQKKFGLSRDSVTDAIGKLRSSGQIPQDFVAPPRKRKYVIPTRHINSKSFRRNTVDLSEVAGEYDEEAKILAGLETMGTRLIKDNDFRVVLGVPIDRWKAVSTMEKFSVNKRELKTKRFRGVYWGKKETIEVLSKKKDIL